MRLPHKRLILKLRSYGIGGQVISWITALLSGRKQRVVVGGSSSEWKDVTSGVPQGSVIGPLLFIIYINDLPDNIVSTLYMFADDTKCFREIAGPNDQGILQSDLDQLQKWSKKWLLQFHPEKCKIMTISKLKTHTQRGYTMQNEGNIIRLERAEMEKDLGIMVDEQLTFETHINEKINKASRVMGLIRRSFVHLNRGNFKRLYVALVRPHLEFGNIIWSPIRKKDIISLENVQRRATRMIPGLKNLS